ncbi:hypothetical protein QQF73_09665 [Marinobacter sp. M216]|uniref:DUF1127 domain-containing protein n=1 Tax=Marinobacter albus TaxID=3030833 RepID=A0ABT7HC03_9GAMM|nr:MULTISPECIES: hypothetical protein [unclassified Marinobacter]MBW7469851.1 hypothetical protein [Marinobacter sp. F4218]MDK9557889.1 hypothetical protein [Marinobacter sp. M216]
MNAQSLLFKRFRTYLQNYATRKALRNQLHQMSRQELDSLVRDIGIPGSDLIEEANTPFWSTGGHEDSSKRHQQPADIAVLASDQCRYAPTA